MIQTPASLLERLRQPNPQEAWERLVLLYTPLIYSWARQVGLTETDAADLVQDVFVALLQTLPTFDYDASKSFRRWLRTVTLNNSSGNSSMTYSVGWGASSGSGSGSGSSGLSVSASVGTSWSSDLSSHDNYNDQASASVTNNADGSQSSMSSAVNHVWGNATQTWTSQGFDSLPWASPGSIWNLSGSTPSNYDLNASYSGFSAFCLLDPWEGRNRYEEGPIPGGSIFGGPSNPNRLPDFIAINLSVGEGLQYSPEVTLDRYGVLYVNPLRFGFGASAFPVGGA